MYPQHVRMGWLPQLRHGGVTGIYVGDYGDQWSGGEGTQPATTSNDFLIQKQAAVALQQAANALLAQVADLSLKTAGTSDEVETLKGELSTLVAQAAALVASSGAQSGGNYDALHSALVNYKAQYADIMSRAVPNPPDPPVVHNTPAGPVVVAAPPKPPIAVAPTTPSWTLWGGVLLVGAVVAKIAKLW